MTFDESIKIEIPKRTYIPIFRFNSKQREEAQPHGRAEPSPAGTSDDGLSIAVLPFTGSPLPESRDFADNIAESIVNGLAQFRELHIIGPLLGYKNRPADTDEVGKRYNARFVLQGRVQMYGDLLRITPVLTDTHTGFKIWSQTYEYTNTSLNLLEVEDDVSRRIVSTLADYSGVIPCLIISESLKKSEDFMDLTQAICCQKYYLKVFTKHVHLAAVAALENIVKTDTDNAIAPAMLSNAYCYNYIFDLGIESASLEKAERLARRALALDSECQIAHLTEAVLHFFQGQADLCIARLEMTTSLNPLNAYVIYSSGVLKCMMGFWNEGMKLWEQATHLNPHHPPIYFIAPFMNQYCKGNFNEAWNYALRFNAPLFCEPMFRAATAGQLGLQAQAAAALGELLEMRPDFPTRAYELLHRLVYLEEHVDMLMDGLFKAGFKLNAGPSQDRQDEIA